MGDNSIELHGDTAILYELQTPLEVHKFVVFKLEIGVIEKVHEIRACLYENEEDALGRQKMVGEEFRCSILLPGSVEISAGALFEDRKSFITHIRFEQVNIMPSRLGKTILSKLSILTDDKIRIFDAEGNCVDKEASKESNDITVEQQCYCAENFVASNGGKILGNYDTCIQCLLDTTICATCLPESHCAFDDEPCAVNRDCAMGSCENGMCRPGVSIFEHDIINTCVSHYPLLCSLNIHFYSFYLNLIGW